MYKTAALALALAALGCGDNNGSSDAGVDMTAAAVPHNFDEINSLIIKSGCTFSVCHNQSNAPKAGNLDLFTDPYAALVGKPADNKKAASQGLLRVKPCDSAHSFLITKLTLPANTDPLTDYGHVMPDVADSRLPNEQIQAIKDWIDRGALKSEPATASGNTCTLTGDMAAHD